MQYILLLLIISSAYSVDFEYDNDVLVLSEETFDEALATFDYLLLEFYAPWCGHCKKLAPEYENAAKDFKEEDIHLAKIDATVQKKLAEKYGVSGYPTLKFMLQGKQIDFDGGRTTDGIKQWIYQHINPGSTQLDQLEEIEKEIKAHEILFFYFADDQPKDTKDRDFRRFKEFSYTIKGAHFAHTHTKGLREKLQVSGTTNFVAFKGGKVVPYTQKLKIPEMKGYVEIVMKERVLNLSEEYGWILERLEKGRPALFYFDDSLDKVVLEAAQNHPADDYLLFVEVAGEKKAEFLSKFEIKDAEGLIIVQKDQKFKLSSALNKDSVLTFISDWKGGVAQKYLKSQESPVNEKGPLKVIVGATYEQEVQKSDSDVVIAYYESNNEEHGYVIKQLEQVALRLEKSEVRFAKIDVSQNQVDDLEEKSLEVVRIRFYKKSGEWVKFTLRANKLQEERMVKWVKEHASGKVNDPKEEL